MQELITFEKTFSQADFDEFARISGDKNPIHVDAEFSAATGFGRNVAHGLLICTVLRGLYAKAIPNAVQQSQTVKFSAPTYANEAMLYTVWLKSESDDQVELAFAVKRVEDNVVTCEGECIMQREAK